MPLPDPALQDGELCLRAWTVADAAALVAAWHDPEVARWTGVPPRIDEAAAAGWIAGEADRRARGLALDLVIDVKGDVAGEIGLVQLGTATGTAEIGWWVAPTHRGRGLAASAARLVAEWAVAELSIDVVVARCQAVNPASGGVASAAGFSRCNVPDDTSSDELWRFG